MGLFQRIIKKDKGSSPELLKLLEGYELPSFPATVFNLLDKLRDPETPMDVLARELELDPGLHVRVLKTVNSAAFGLSHKVSSVLHAVSLLGRSRLEALVLAVAVKNGLASQALPGWFNANQFWQSASRRAAVARALAQEFDPRNQAEAFSAALLQDMGVPVLVGLKGAAYQQTYNLWQSDQAVDLTILEQKAFGVDHQQIGSCMADKWGFPQPLVAAIALHHQREDNPEVSLPVRAVSLLKDQPAAAVPATLSADLHQIFGLDSSNLGALLDEALVAGKDLADALV